jgi:hypothetical protein
LTDQLEPTSDSAVQTLDAPTEPVITGEEAPAAPARVSPIVLTGLGLLVLAPVALAIFGGTSYVALVCFALSVLGMVVCGMGWARVGASEGRLRGARLAAGGMLLGLAFIAILFLVSQAHSTIARNNCLTNQKEISLALIMYAQDYGHFPKDWTVAKQYTDATLEKSGPDKWICPARNWLDPRPAHGGYGMNAALAGQPMGGYAEPSTLLLTADATAVDGLIRPTKDAQGRDASADLDRNRHGGVFLAAFADGSVRRVIRGEIVRLQP